MYSPLISILINNYNYGRFLGDALSSALAQDYDNFEVIVVDDGSTDHSATVIAEYATRVRAVLKENGGQASAFNAGFEASRGEIILFLDSDDLFVPEKATRIAKIFKENPEVGWCFERICEFNDVTGVRSDPPPDTKSYRWDARKLIEAGKTPHIPTATSGMSFTRETLAQILPMPEMIRITSDGYLKLLALFLTEGWMSFDQLTLQRIHGGNAYTGRSGGKKALVAKVGMQIGVSLWDKSPRLEKLAKIIFARGLGLSWIAGKVEAEKKQLEKDFFARVSIQTRAEILLRSALWTARNRFRA